MKKSVSSKTKTPKAKSPEARSPGARSTTTRTPKARSPRAESPRTGSPSQLIDARIQELDDWRGQLLGRLRTIIKKADPGVVEEWKWNIPVWSHDGLICTGEVYKSAVKLTFAKGAALPDPSGVFNSSLEGNTRRAVDFHEGAEINEKALTTLVRDAVTLNKSRAKR